MLSVTSIVSATFSSICPGMMPKSLRLMLKVERMTSRSPFWFGTRWGQALRPNNKARQLKMDFKRLVPPCQPC